MLFCCRFFFVSNNGSTKKSKLLFCCRLFWCQKQWQHTNGVGWDAPVAMAHMLREVYLLEDGTFEPSYMPNVTLKLEEGDIANESEAQTAFNNYVK